MKLIYIVNTINGTTGLERMISVQTDYFIKHYGYKIDIILLDQKPDGDAEFFYINPKINRHYLNLNSSGFVNIYEKIRGINRILNNVDFDISVVCIDDVFGLYIPKFINRKIKTVYQRHSTKSINLDRLSNTKKSRLFDSIKKVLINFGGKGYDKFVLLSNDHKIDWRHLKNIAIISNPIIIESGNLQSTLESKIVLAVGRHDPVKGFDKLLKCWINVANQHPNWKLKIAGKKTTTIDLEALAETLGVSESVIFQDFITDMRRTYLDASMLVCTSVLEGFPLVFIEAMSFGVPVVSFDCNFGPRSIIKHNIDGILVPSDNIDLMTKSINHLIENKKFRRQLGDNARVNIQRFSKENIMSNWKRLFEDLLKK